ncbi:MAG: hypothetical protein AB4058_13685 [Microcystaceae cyanobacterium]
MSKICLYLDEDAGKRALIGGLRQFDIDILSTAEANNLQKSDEH